MPNHRLSKRKPTNSASVTPKRLNYQPTTPKRTNEKMDVDRMRNIMREEFDRISSSLDEKLASLADLPKENKEVKHVLTNKLEAHLLINKYERV